MRVAVGALGFTKANRRVSAVRDFAGGCKLVYHWCGTRTIVAQLIGGNRKRYWSSNITNLS